MGFIAGLMVGAMADLHSHVQQGTVLQLQLAALVALARLQRLKLVTGQAQLATGNGDVEEFAGECALVGAVHKLEAGVDAALYRCPVGAAALVIGQLRREGEAEGRSAVIQFDLRGVAVLPAQLDAVEPGIDTEILALGHPLVTDGGNELVDIQHAAGGIEFDQITLEGLGPFLRSEERSTRLNSSHVRISYAVFCLKKKMARTQPSVGAE